MIKKITTITLLGAVLMAPTMSFSAINSATQVITTVKMGGNAQVIRLASNDVSQIQNTEGRASIKVSVSDDSANELSKIPPQAWLVLTALFCFVMRSSRRTV